VRFPVKRVGDLAPVSSRRDAPANNCCVGLLLAAPTGRTATTTGSVKATPGRTDAGGSISNVRLYARLELPLVKLKLPELIVVCVVVSIDRNKCFGEGGTGLAAELCLKVKGLVVFVLRARNET
jgi:hypothetical protein